MKSFRPKGEDGGDGGSGRNAERDFHGEKRSNATHASTTDPDARLYRKGNGRESKLCYMGHALLNRSEEKAYRELQEIAAAYGYDVYIKMRLADILRIDRSGVTKELYSFALQSHFDFLVADEAYHPLFAVEFDGPTHATLKQAARDTKKDMLCERFGLPLLRIGTNHLFRNYNKASLLRWWPAPILCTSSYVSPGTVSGKG